MGLFTMCPEELEERRDAAMREAVGRRLRIRAGMTVDEAERATGRVLGLRRRPSDYYAPGASRARVRHALERRHEDRLREISDEIADELRGEAFDRWANGPCGSW